MTFLKWLLTRKSEKPAGASASPRVLPSEPVPRAGPTLEEQLARLQAANDAAAEQLRADLQTGIQQTANKVLQEELAEWRQPLEDPVRQAIRQIFADHPALEWLLDGEWMSVNSTNVDRIRYFAGDMTLDVEFHSGSWYEYFEVPPEIAAGMYSANSKGRYVWNWLRDVYPFRRLRKGTKPSLRYPRHPRVVRALNKEEIAEHGIHAVRARNLELIRQKLRLK